ncbi:MAG: glycosyltransferase family 2 protein [Lachnospiraceae bacterium]|nr:glycosyltransferase family 2 protein [Lachnospiraceae bacterium]
MSEKTAVVIPNYNGIAYMTDCLEALRLQTLAPDRVIVIDNGSTDGSAELIERSYPECELVRMGRNTGFCGAVNEGIRRSEGCDYVILLNNDTKAEPCFVEELIRAMRKDGRIFSAQAKMLRMSDPELMDDAGDLYCSLGWAFARGKGKPEELFDRPAEIFSACAGAAIYRMSILGEIGTFDENHFAYLEDCDIGWRAKIRGYHNVFVPAARVLHVGSATSGSEYNLFKVKNTSRNSIYLIGKNMPPLQIIINLPLLIPGFAVKAVFFAMKGFGREYMRGIRRGFELTGKGAAEGRINRFEMKYILNYVRIQLELWINTVRRFL